MKKVLLFLLCFSSISMMMGGYAKAQAVTSNRSLHGIHAIGDGKILLYGKQSDIFQFLGPPYSSPSWLQMNYIGSDSVRSVRRKGTAIWDHYITRDDRQICTMTDWIDTPSESFNRHFNSTDTVSYNLDITPFIFYMEYSKMFHCTPADESENIPQSTAYTATLEPGVPFHFVYTSPRGYTYRIVVSGSARLEAFDNDNKHLKLTILPGASQLSVISGPTEADIEKNIKMLIKRPWNKQIKQDEARWKRFTKPLKRFNDSDYPKEVVDAIDDIAVLLKSQQSEQGVLMGGYYWHMGYIRDQFGGIHGLMAMGLYDESKKALQYFYNVFRENGLIHNAQSIGFPKIFHIHENDQVEITGDITLQAFQYYEKTGDKALLKEIFPLLDWCTKVQMDNLIDGMLPFNGDETYIAGGVLDRKVMYDGSAEATLTFIEGTTKLLDFAKREKLWDDKTIERITNAVNDAKARYRSNFFINGIYYANNPNRAKKAIYPLHRSGVCLHPNHGGYFRHLTHFKGSLYFCDSCMKLDNSQVKVPEPELYNIPSVGLLPIYINSSIFTDSEKRGFLNAITDRYQKTGRIAEQNRIMGHDYGMLLSALVRYNHPLKDEIFRRMMNLRDDTGSWSEYFNDGSTPFGSMAHVWSAGTNIEAAIMYIQSKKQ
jgi:hypothetical protein